MSSAIDKIDRHILDILQKSGRVSIVDLAQKVHLTKTPCAERVKRLERSNYILGYQAILNPEKLDCNYESFVQVTLSKTTTDVLKKFAEAVKQIDELQSVHMVAGGFDYLLKLRTRDIAHFREVLGSQLSQLPCVQQTHTYVVMESVKDRTTIPIN